MACVFFLTTKLKGECRVVNLLQKIETMAAQFECKKKNKNEKIKQMGLTMAGIENTRDRKTVFYP